MLVTVYQTNCHHIPEYCYLHSYCHEKLKSHILKLFVLLCNQLIRLYKKHIIINGKEEAGHNMYVSGEALQNMWLCKICVLYSGEGSYYDLLDFVW
jgi:hypothetical protein